MAESAPQTWDLNAVVALTQKCVDDAVALSKRIELMIDAQGHATAEGKQLLEQTKQELARQFRANFAALGMDVGEVRGMVLAQAMSARADVTTPWGAFIAFITPAAKEAPRTLLVAGALLTGLWMVLTQGPAFIASVRGPASTVTTTITPLPPQNEGDAPVRATDEPVQVEVVNTPEAPAIVTTVPAS